MNKNTEKSFQPRPSAIGLAVALAFGSASPGWALPTGEQVVAGQVSVGRPNAGNMVIRQGTSSAIVNWNSFSIGGGEAVRIQQPGASSVILNRVLGNNPSDIYGQLSANGKVFLVNPNGVLFGRTASVDVGSFVASTLAIGNSDFLDGRYIFSGNGGPVVNQGSISAAQSGTVALLGGTVRNDGSIAAKLGTVALGAGRQVTLDLAGDGLSTISVTQAALDAQIANGGVIVADGGQVLLSARALESLTGNAINQSGVVRARTLVERNGRIVLDGGEIGATLVSGAIDATGGQSGLRGGEVQVLGHHVGIVGNATLDASGAAGGGNVLVGGDYQGKNAAVRNAQATFVGRDATLRSDASETGDGGKLIVWGDDATRAYGNLSARGGANGGNGGMIETSGKFLDIAGVRVAASAARGVSGQWLLDPANITVSHSSPTGGGISPLPNFTAGNTSATVLDTDLNNALNTNTNVVLDTGAAPAVFNSIGVNFDAVIQKTSPGVSNLTLRATGNVSVFGTIGATGGPLNLTLVADTNGDRLGGAYLFGANISTNGGAFAIRGGGAGGAAGAYFQTDGFLLFPSIRIVNATSINTGGGTFSARGDSVGMTTPSPAVVIGGSGILTGAGQIQIAGTAGGANTTDGVSIAFSGDFPSRLQTTSGSISIVGNAANAGAAGVRISDSTIQSGSGPVGIIGIATGAGGVGVSNDSAALVRTTGGGSIDIRGRGATGVHFDGNCLGDGCTPAQAVTTGSPGSISISGESTGSGFGIELAGGALVGDAAESGNVILRAANQSLADSIDLRDTFSSASISTTGNIALRPGGVSASGGLTEAPTTAIGLGTASAGFQLSSGDLAALHPAASGAVIIGSDLQSGRITVAGVPSFGSNITLQNEGAGSAGISLPDGIVAPGRTIALATRGPLNLVGPVAGSRLLVKADGAVSLTDPSNSVGTLMVDPPSSFNYAQDNALVIGSFAAIGVAGGNVAPIALTANATSLGNFFAQSRNGSITLGTGIATLNPASTITLVAGTTFNNSGHATLSPGAGGVWQIWADTWAGETRGGLAPGNALPNLYGCVFPACGISGVTVGPGNHFLYTQRPTVSVVGGSFSRQVGEPNPPLDTFAVSGVLASLGDTRPDAVTGSFSTSATTSSGVGTYPIDGAFTSPSGYVVNVRPGSLNVVSADVPPVIIPPVITPPVVNPEPPSRGFLPPDVVAEVLRNTPETSFVYDRNLGLPAMCAATGPALLDKATQGVDILSLEWSRVRQRPNLSNCVDLGERNGCSDF